MDISPAEQILYEAVGEVFNRPHETHKELTNKRASVMLMEKLDDDYQVIAQTGLLKWAFIPCFQQMFHDTNALPMNLQSTFQMVLDFLAYVHDAKIQILGQGDDIPTLAVIRGGETVPYRGAKRARTLRYTLRMALEVERYNSSDLSGGSVVETMAKFRYLFQGEGEGGTNNVNAAEAIDGILGTFRKWIPTIETYQDHHVIVDCFIRALQDEGLEIVEASG
ncbi:MAG: hypothetical protein O7H41_08280 [Planctomycetota bacterium]|nr:hypothetical protein [Planctomycetota bacterium]